MHEIIIEPDKSVKHYWRELWQYRGLFYFLTWRDLLVRYKQTVFGIAWSVLRPVLTMLILTVVFGKIAHLPSGGTPYPILVFVAMLPWQFFSSTLTVGGTSIVTHSNMITKIYFPRLIIPTTSMVVSLVDFAISFVLLLVLMIVYGFWPNSKIFVLPLLLILAAMTSLGIGYWVTALNVKYRDFRYIIPFLVQFGLYISPVGFSSALVPDAWRLIYSLNPMVGVIDGFRWALLGNQIVLYIPGFILSIVLSMILFISGIWFFRKTERSFADII
ncbi:MAG: ABC transporter permease [Sedimentisphaerales bacterium]|nr:ABC transporter permease [Sedimentisphaerales bacterium]